MRFSMKQTGRITGYLCEGTNVCGVSIRCMCVQALILCFFEQILCRDYNCRGYKFHRILPASQSSIVVQ